MVEAAVGWLPNFVANRVRTQALRVAGIRIGYTSAFFGLPTLLGRGKIYERLSIGEHCGFNKGSLFDLESPITLGNDVAVGHDVMFLTSTHERGPATQRAGARRSAPIVIGNGVWLGARATILPGVTVGAGAVVSAGVTVTDDVPENMLLTGTHGVSLARWRK
ncbi:MAG TPA: acyltransferase [Polyangiaceae bacterium]|nr:acyltransferase [Polyangiaceae bacterium]